MIATRCLPNASPGSPARRWPAPSAPPGLPPPSRSRTSTKENWPPSPGPGIAQTGPTPSIRGWSRRERDGAADGACRKTHSTMATQPPHCSGGPTPREVAMAARGGWQLRQEDRHSCLSGTRVASASARVPLLAATGHPSRVPLLAATGHPSRCATACGNGASLGAKHRQPQAVPEETSPSADPAASPWALLAASPVHWQIPPVAASNGTRVVETLLAARSRPSQQRIDRRADVGRPDRLSPTSIACTPAVAAATRRPGCGCRSRPPRPDRPESAAAAAACAPGRPRTCADRGC